MLQEIKGIKIAHPPKVRKTKYNLKLYRESINYIRESKQICSYKDIKDLNPIMCTQCSILAVSIFLCHLIKMLFDLTYLH